jgi:proteasome lid subunit RPN8/RPN11
VRALSLTAPLVGEMTAHAREAYPDECCGFLLGPFPPPDGETVRRVSTVERAENDFVGERRRRFLIRPEELRELERRTEREGRAVLGFYHSHPDHPARPSLFDQEHAWPWYAYVVLSVTSANVASLGAFELDAESSTFHELPLTIAEADAAESRVAGG